MPRLIFADHGAHLYTEVAWSDGHGPHTRNPYACGDLPGEQELRMRDMLMNHPEIVRWEIERHAGKVAVGVMRERDVGPQWTSKLSKRIETEAAELLSWAEGYCNEWRAKNDDYELERHIERLQVEKERLRGERERRGG